MNIPAVWEQHLRAGTEFGRRVAAAIDRNENKPVRRNVVVVKDGVEETRSRLHRQAISVTPEENPFAERPRVNLVYHIWPRKGGWQWHADRLRDLIPLCDGKVIIGVSTDSDTDSAEVVKAELPFDQIEWLETANLPRVPSGSHYRVGELQTAVPAMQMLNVNEDSVTLYGHAKGQQDHTIKNESIKIWSELMYESVLFRVDEAIEKMALGYSAFGSMRAFGLRPLMPRYKWHYSGTFYAFRTKDFVQNGRFVDYQLRYGGTEAWPGDCVPAYKAYCTLGDNVDIASCYNLDSIYDRVTEHLNKVSFSHGPVPMQQHFREFEWLKPQFTGMQRVLIIGSYSGGLEYYLGVAHPGVEFTSIDIEPQDNSVARNMIVGDSKDLSVQDRVRGAGSFDAVFIDGDHSYEGVCRDWEFAKSLCPRKIFFHDITQSSWHEKCGSFVHRLWNEIKQNHETDEKTVGCGWGGIGVVNL